MHRKPVTIYAADVTNSYILIRYHDHNHRDKEKLIRNPSNNLLELAASMALRLSAGDDWHVTPHFGDPQYGAEMYEVGWSIDSTSRAMLHFEKLKPKLQLVK